MRVLRSTTGLKRSAAFTLLEMLVVIGIIAVLAVALIPAVSSLSKSNARKGTIGLLLGVFEQARGIAIKDGRATYVVFPAQYPAGTSATTDPNLISRYFYHSVAIFEDDTNDPPNRLQVTEWKVFPTGVSIRSEISYSTSTAQWSGTTFNFTPTQSSATFPFLKYNSNGQVESPSPTPTPAPDGSIPLRVFEGSVSGTFEHPTNPKNFDELIRISPVSGRAVYTPQ
jgi:prepilin-type N-terminal cleavage/methylation domain-containing protein